MKNLRSIRISAVMALMLCAACAGVQTTPGVETPSASSKEALLQRADTYWQAKIRVKLEKMYPLETPEFRKRFSIVDYSRHYGAEVVFRGAEVKSAEIDGTHAIVKVRVRYSFFGLYSPKGGAAAVVRDHWTLMDGKWYHLINAPGTKFNPKQKK